MLEIININHITINVVDLEMSEEFYQKAMGLKKTGFINMGDHTLTYFKLTEESNLELISYSKPESRIRTGESNTGIYRHFCLQINNLFDFYENCKDKNVTIRKVPSLVKKLEAYTMLIVDPNGVEIELIEK